MGGEGTTGHREVGGGGGFHTIPICLSTVDIRLFDDSTNNFDMTSFSTARTTPS